ncbi:MAG: DUF1840 domain-containing protein [Brachymonas sp.]|nr:DUF1840 domain-containing protein [Brachymonas sp.]
MLYKFKSQAGSDVIMLEATGKQVLQIIGKGTDAKGILLSAQMPAARQAIEAAISIEEAQVKQRSDERGEDNREASNDAAHTAQQRIGLRTRAWPLVILMERSEKADVPITWGV